MSRLQWISDLSKNDLKILFNSIDYVLFDIDGVLIYDRVPIPGAPDAVAKLRKLVKKIAFVSNNTIYPLNVIAQNLTPFGVTEDEIMTPIESLLAYLKKIEFKKDIYVVGCSLPKRRLREAGYNVIEYKDICTHELEENLTATKDLMLNALDICKNVGAVYMDLDFNLCLGSLQVAKIVLDKIKDVLFLTGIRDDIGNVSKDMQLAASQFYIDGLERWTNRKSTLLGKPGIQLKYVLNSALNIPDDSRVLFIGDNISVDIAFGVNCGFKTLLVLSGVTSKNQLQDPNLPEDIKPTYIAKNLGELYERIKDL